MLVQSTMSSKGKDNNKDKNMNNNDLDGKSEILSIAIWLQMQTLFFCKSFACTVLVCICSVTQKTFDMPQNDLKAIGNFLILSLIIFIFIILIFYSYSITVLCLFSLSVHPIPTKHPSLPLDFVHVSFIVVPVTPLLTVTSPLPPDHCQIVLHFNVYGYILFPFFSYILFSN